MAEQFKRHTAYKLWINTVHTSPAQNEDNGSSLLQFEGKDVMRVNIIGAVVDVFSSESYGSLMLDDGSGSIRC